MVYNFKNTISAFLLVLCISSSSYAEKICSVHDGDTFKTCKKESIRVWGIDAPELKQPLGKDSRDYLKKLVLNKDIDLECFGKSYNRRVCKAYVVRSGKVISIQNEMVLKGLAYDSPKYSKGLYSNSEKFAQSLNRGVWALPDGGVRPWDWRKK